MTVTQYGDTTPPAKPPNGIVAGRPMIERAEPKLTPEKAAQARLETAAPHSTIFLARLYFLATRR